ncbi:THO complex subunit 7 homolog isoform X2 [Artemia franciscana]|uniref:THO complex subunit 7 homolog n=1 Tax=Artemia franciscana TaxID=6661 RepID=A0AA88I053_ARTSF|nr:hypothetical protein QYM36_003590 [Artemia franciscana]
MQILKNSKLRLSSICIASNPETNMNEEEILRRRLLVDGDGAGDEKKILGIFRDWVKLCTWKYESLEEFKNDEELLKFHLSQAEWNMLKTHLIIGMTSKEEKAYNSLHESIGKKIEELRNDILTAKKDLENAQIVRKQRMEYDSIAKLICQYPNRKEEEKQLKETRRQLADSERKLRDLDQKIELRTKQFMLLMDALYMLESTLENEDESGIEIDNEKLDDVSLDSSTEFMEH